MRLAPKLRLPVLVWQPHLPGQWSDAGPIIRIYQRLPGVLSSPDRLEQQCGPLPF